MYLVIVGSPDNFYEAIQESQTPEDEDRAWKDNTSVLIALNDKQLDQIRTAHDGRSYGTEVIAVYRYNPTGTDVSMAEGYPESMGTFEFAEGESY